MSQQRVSINPKRVEELAVMASKMDPAKIAQYNEEMEQQLAQRMKTMTPQELENLATVQKFVTDKTVQVLQQKPQPQEHDEDFLNHFDEPTKQDQILLQALRTRPIDTFVGVFLQQNRTASSEVRFHSDNESHPILHWAALEDKLEIVRYLCAQVRVNVNAQNFKGETALHWACVKGHTRSIHVLLHEFKAHSNICDNKGYSLLHLAAQNGHVLTLAQLNRKGKMLDLDLRDNGGRTPLHWACYRGYMDVCRWLLTHGADPDAEDYEKCSPLHWAAIRSHADVCQLLVQLGDAGGKLFSLDATGKTPRMLAEGKIEQAEAQNDRTLVMQYKRVASYCLEWESLQKLIDGNLGKPTFRMRLSGKMPHASYFLWPVLAPVGFYQYCTWILPATSQYMLLHFLFLLCFFGKWLFWSRLQTKDPGDYVMETGKAGSILGYGTVSPSWGWRRNGWPDFSRRLRNRDSRLEATVPNAKLEGAQRHRDLYHRVLDEGLLVPVCTTCEIVKPARAKHDAISNVCVLKFDHFCPWMNASIGQHNYLDFFMTALCASVAMWLWVFFVFTYTRYYTAHGTWLENAKQVGIAWELFAWSYAVLALYGSAMTGQHIMLASRNMSTNEMISGSRYRYLVEDGARGNPFNRGIIKNFMELFGLLQEQPNIDPEQYHKQAFVFGNEPQELKEAQPGSPWYRKRGAGSHGHSHDNGDCHGHSH